MPWRLTNSNTKGSAAEKLALRYLKRNRLKHVDSNFAVSCGELDLIMLDGSTLVFIEVRSRSKSRFGSAIESITASKIKKIKKTAQWFLQCHAKYHHRPCRFDVIAITYNNANGQDRLEWIKGAF
ncbi:MAG: YraN family protein [Endozoicomonas sp. (ex Botrylloides leachii)]|nr:YraN family protein [Endozoicomonas sp. (ex Botrylloides leachii)]